MFQLGFSYLVVTIGYGKGTYDRGHFCNHWLRKGNLRAGSFLEPLMCWIETLCGHGVVTYDDADWVGWEKANWQARTRIGSLRVTS